MDTLNATINANVAATTRISNIEVLNFTGFGARTVDTLNIQGAEQIWSVNSTGKMTMSNVASLAPTFGVAGNVNSQIDVTLVAGVDAGPSDIVKFALKDVTAAELNVTANGMEVVDLTVVGDTSSLKSISTGAPVVNVKGDATTLKIIETPAAGLANAFSPLDALANIVATEFSGAIIGNTIASNGFTTDKILGANAGTTMALGDGDHNLHFVNTIAAATPVNTIQLGNGDNKLEFVQVAHASNGASFIFAGSGDDVVRIGGSGANTGMRATDLISLGAGTDTVRIKNDQVNTLVMQGVENLLIEPTAIATNVINFSDQPLAVTVQAGAGATTSHGVTGLPTGSTVTVTNASGVTTGAHDLTFGWATKQAAETIQFNAKTAGILTASNVTALTLNYAEAAANAAAGDDIIADEATSITINAAKAFQNGDIGNAADGVGTKLKTLTIEGQDAVTVVDVLSTVLETVSITGAKNVGAGAFSNAAKLTSLSVVSSGGNAQIGAVGGSGTNNVTDPLNITVTAGKAATLSTVGHATGAGKLGDVTVTATDGLLTTGAITAGAVGSINLTSTNGAIKGAATKAIIAADSTGINVNLTAKGAIDDGAGTPAKFLVENTGGNITATIAGTTTTAATSGAIVDLVAVTSGLVNLTATNTGGLLSTVTNAGTAGTAQTSTLTLGNAASGKVNALTVAGTVDNVVITGGTGVDNVVFGDANKIKTASFKLGTGDNSIDFSKLGVVTATNGVAAGSLGTVAGKAGLAINLSNDDFVFLPNTANATTIKANSVNQFEAGASVKNVITGFSGTIDAGTVKTVIGTAQADWIKANNSSGNVIQGDDGVDTQIGGAGNDTFVITGTAKDANDIIDGGAGVNTLNVTATTDFADVDGNITNIQNIKVTGASTLTLTGQTEGFNITDGGNEDVDQVIIGGAGNDTFTSGNAADTDTFKFASTAALNGVDTLLGFTLTTGTDVLNFNAFLGATIDVTGAVALDSVNFSIGDSLDFGTTTVNVIVLNDIQTLTVANFGLPGATKIGIGNNQKVVVIADDVGDADSIMNIYYVVGGANGDGDAAASVTLVGTINEVDLANIAANNFA